jgi:hypothetical protein
MGKQGLSQDCAKGTQKNEWLFCLGAKIEEGFGRGSTCLKS